MAVLEWIQKNGRCFFRLVIGEMFFFDRGVPEGTEEKDVIPLLLKKNGKKGRNGISRFHFGKVGDWTGILRIIWVSRIENIVFKNKNW